MLTHLSLNNFVLIDRLDLEIAPGLCVITGETGAGKSILLTALALVTGARGQPGLIGKHGTRADVTASFELPRNHPCRALLNEQELDQGSEVLLRRTLIADGRTRAYVNGRNVPIALLASLGTHLVEIQGQFDQLAILSPSNHRRLLDEALGLQDDLNALARLHGARNAAEQALAQEDARLAKLAEDQDYLQHCLRELEQANIKDGEVEALTERRAQLRELSAAGEALGQLAKLMNADKGLIDSLTKASRIANRLPAALAEEMASMIASLDQAWNAGESAATALESKLAELSSAEQSLEETSERLFFLKDLSRKHDCQPEELGAKTDSLRATLAQLDQGQARLRALAAACAASRAAYLRAATALSQGRKAGAARLMTAINAELPALRLPEAQVEIRVDGEADENGSPQGFDKVRLYAQTNRGNTAGPLEKTVSGGELSRILLALKLALSPQNSAGGAGQLLVFDEADAGIGGATAAALGSRLRRLAQTTQVLSVTHSPQLAAAGHWHLRVHKQSHGAYTDTKITALDDAARTQEIARMLAGSHVGTQAAAAALSLRKEFTAP